MNDGPKFAYTFALLFFGAIFGAIGVLWTAARTVFYFGAFLCAVGMVVIFLDAVISARAGYWQMIGWASRDIAQLPDERFQVLGLTFPKVRVRWGVARAVQYFDDTNATMKQFKVFMQGSDAAQIYPERNCNAELPRSIWNEIRICLEDYGHIVRDSHAGSHSWLWTTPNTFANLRAFFGTYIDPHVRELE